LPLALLQVFVQGEFYNPKQDVPSLIGVIDENGILFPIKEQIIKKGSVEGVLVRDKKEIEKQILQQIDCCEGFDESGPIAAYLFAINPGIIGTMKELDLITNKNNLKIIREEASIEWLQKNNMKNKETLIQKSQDEIERLKKPEEQKSEEELKSWLIKQPEFYKKRVDDLNKILSSVN
jgi:hypothetical protein